MTSGRGSSPTLAAPSPVTWLHSSHSRSWAEMSTLLSFTIVGVVTGAIYAVAASGLVVTYTTSGIFNFAHGAIGMFMAFVYWELRINQGWPAPLALIVVLLVLSPLMGALIEGLLMRRLYAA